MRMQLAAPETKPDNKHRHPDMNWTRTEMMFKKELKAMRKHMTSMSVWYTFGNGRV